MGCFHLGDALIGKAKHFFDKISVVVIELSAPLKVGDKIKFKHGEEEFEQSVDSMQIEHDPIQEASAGQAIGMKTTQKVHEGTEVYKVE